MEGQVQLVNAARTPVLGRHTRTGRGHDASLVLALAVCRVVLHAKVVADLMRHCRGHHRHNLAVVHRDTARELVRADGSLQCLAHDPSVKLFPRQQLGVVVGEHLDEGLAAVVQEVLQRLVAIAGQLHLVLLAPDHHADEGDEDVQWRVDGVDDVRYRLAVVVHAPQTVVHRLVDLVVDDQHQLNVGRVSVRVEWAAHLIALPSRSLVLETDQLMNENGQFRKMANLL